ncbi:MAG: hypothetical protein IJY89_02430 [Clostridia bacterium]|nr:hypothetical protein [Clostridia bacterium]
MKKLRYAVIVLAILLGVSVPAALYGVAAATTGTPLVLVSEDYITNYLMPLFNQQNSAQNTEIESLNNKYNTLLAQYEALNESYNKLLENGVVGGGTTAVPGFLSVKLEAGNAIFPTGDNQVCLEVIVQRGNAVVVSPIETQGVLDTSTGLEILNGAPAVLNHYLLIPHANDGRAIAAIDTDVWILVRGEYTIEAINQ